MSGLHTRTWIAVTAVVIATVVAAPTGQGRADAVGTLFYDRLPVVALDADESALYFSSYGSCPGGDLPQGSCHVRRIPMDSDSGWEHQITRQLATPDRLVTGRIATADGWVYWADNGGHLYRARSWRGEPELVATASDRSAQVEIAVDATHLWWVESSTGSAARLYRKRSDGVGTRRLLLVNEGGSFHDLVADGQGGVLYLADRLEAFCCTDILERVTVTARGDVLARRAATMFIDTFVVDGDVVHSISDRRVVGGDIELRSRPLRSLTEETVITRLSDAGDPVFRALAADGHRVYWHATPSGGEGPVMRYTTGNPAPEALTDNVANVKTILPTEEHVYWLQGEEIHRLATGVAGRFIDLDGDDIGLEVTQALQNEANSVFLVAGKRTFVRAFANIGDTNTGVSELRMFPVAVLHGRDSDGSTLPGSPLQPVEHEPIRALPVDRTNMDTTVLFELPESWTEEGTITLQSQVNPDGVVSESFRANNLSAEREVTFETRRNICLEVVPVMTTRGSSVAGWSPEHGEYFARATSMVPARIRGLFRGGTPRTIPLVNDPYDFNNEHHENMLLMNLTVEYLFSGSPASCGDDWWIVTAWPNHPEGGGRSNAVANNMWSAREKNAIATFNDPRGGRTLAHEVGHQVGRWHVACPVEDGPAFPDPNYPYPRCQIDHRNDHLGFDVLTRQLILPLNADGTSNVGDLMSYAARRWTSFYIYNAMWEWLRPGAIFGQPVSGADASAGDGGSSTSSTTSTSPSDEAPPPDIGDEAPPPQPSGALRVLAGLVGDAGATLSYAYDVPTSGLDRVQDALTRGEESQTYSLVASDADGTILQSEPLRPQHLDDGDIGTELFMHAVHPDAAKVEIHTTDGAVIGTLGGGSAAPSVEILSPRAGDSPVDELTVRWSGEDADGDELRYAVRYSADGGQTWAALGAELTDTELTVALDTLPGGDQAMVEVTASDGLRSTTASAGPFSISTHAPSVAILDTDLTPIDPDEILTLRQSDTLELEGAAYDVEDGELVGADLTWKVDGPLAAGGTGEVLRVPDLQPGRYTVELTATDTEGRTASTSVQVRVGPKQVPATEAPQLDGTCEVSGPYAADTDPVTLHHARGRASGVMVQAATGLYVCVEGLPRTAEDGAEVFTLHVDPEGDGEGPTAFYRAGSDGALVTGTVSALGEVTENGDAPGFAARLVKRTSGTWAVELFVAEQHVSRWTSLPGMLLVDGTDAVWPRTGLVADAGTWGLVELSGDTPPRMEPPPVIIIPGETPDGTVVPFDVPVHDREDPSPTVTCTPSSGTLFALGTTTVTCTARDAGGNTSTTSFTVDVVPTERTRLHVVRDGLAATSPSDDPKVDERIASAVGHLDGALATELWGDHGAPTVDGGGTVYKHVKSAVQDLQVVSGTSATAATASAELVGASGALALASISETTVIVDMAAGDTTEAEQYLAEARTAYVDGQNHAGAPSGAVAHHDTAWRKSQEAVAAR